jgi:hypothetical protein
MPRTGREQQKKGRDGMPLLGISAANADGTLSNENFASRIIPYQELILIVGAQRPPHLKSCARLCGSFFNPFQESIP